MSSKEFYQNEVFLWRGIGATGVSVLILPATTLLFTVLINFSILSPYQWAKDVCWMLLSPSNWIYIAVMGVVFVIGAASMIQFFTVYDEKGVTRLARILSLLKPRVMLHVAIQGLGGATITWCSLRIIGGPYTYLRQMNTDTGIVELNEYHVFVLVHAVYVGLLSGFMFFTNHNNVVQYPPNQQSIWNASRDHMGHIFKRSVKFVLNKMIFYYLLYYIILGGVIKGIFVRSFGVTLKTSIALNSIWGMMDIWLAFWTCFTGVLFMFYCNMFIFIYTLYQTEPYEMTIQPNVDGEDECKLTDALASDSFPLFQFQAYQDLFLLSKQSAYRRSQLFSLSPLGGHPHNWTDVSEKCLASLKAFTEELHRYNCATLGNGAPKYTSPVATNGKAVNASEKPSMKDQVYTSLQQTKALSYLLSTPPDVALRKVLAHAQKHTWNVQAMANLVVASYVEDKYGVVQKSLPDVIAALIALRDEVEKMCKLTGSTARGDNPEMDPHAQLRSSLKIALYNIVATFAPHIDAIKLTPEIKKKLKLFSEYKV